MKHLMAPPLWLIIFIVGLPQLSENIYTTALPSIEKTLQTSPAFVEWTLTIYLLGFAVGTLFWGRLSDKLGRKICILIGLVLFFVGCIGCFLSESIEALLSWRFIQAFGGSIGSVLGQAVCRDVYKGKKLREVYSVIGASLAVFPAIGPFLGGIVSQFYGWRFIFLILGGSAILLFAFVKFCLQETKIHSSGKLYSLKLALLKMVRDRKVLRMGFLVGGANGIAFSYFAEAPFYLMETLGVSPSLYGASFILTAASTFLGGVFSKNLQKTWTGEKILKTGVWAMGAASFLMLFVALLKHLYWSLPSGVIVILTISLQMLMMFSFCLVVSNALSMALENYKKLIGTASSLFGFYYYVLISVLTFGMGLLHNGTLLPMPMYFTGISVLMMISMGFGRKPYKVTH